MARSTKWQDRKTVSPYLHGDTVSLALELHWALAKSMLARIYKQNICRHGYTSMLVAPFHSITMRAHLLWQKLTWPKCKRRKKFFVIHIRCSLAENPADLPYCITKSRVFIVLNKTQYNREVWFSVLSLLCKSWMEEVLLFLKQRSD